MKHSCSPCYENQGSLFCSRSNSTTGELKQSLPERNSENLITVLAIPYLSLFTVSASPLLASHHNIPMLLAVTTLEDSRISTPLHSSLFHSSLV